MLRDFFKSSGNENIVFTYETTTSLTEKDRNRALRLTVDFAVGRFGKQLCLKVNITRCARALVQLFPLIFTEEALIGTKKGLLMSRAIARRNQNSRVAKKLSSASSNNSMGSQPSISNSQDLIFQYLINLKHSVARDEVNIKQLLDLTREVRKQATLVEEKRQELIARGVNVQFGFFFVNYDLISYDFEQWFPAAHTIEHFRRLLNGISIASNGTYKLCNEYKKYPTEIQPFIKLVELVGIVKLKVKVDGGHDTIEKALSRLVVIKNASCNTDAELLKNQFGNKQPYVVVKYDEETERIIQCYLSLDGKLYPFPSSMEFNDVFDKLFKIHHLFGLEYPIALKKFYFLIEKYVYMITQQNDAKVDLLMNSYILIHI